MVQADVMRFLAFSKCLWRGLRQSFERLVGSILKQLDYSLSISMRDSWHELRSRQLPHDRNVIYFFF